MVNPSGMPRTYVDLTFTSAGANVLVVVRKLQDRANVSFITGEHDLYFDWQTQAEFDAHMTVIHAALRGTGATYRVHTLLDRTSWAEPVPWPPPLDSAVGENPAFPKRPKEPGVERIR